MRVVGIGDIAVAQCSSILAEPPEVWAVSKLKFEEVRARPPSNNYYLVGADLNSDLVFWSMNSFSQNAYLYRSPLGEALKEFAIQPSDVVDYWNGFAVSSGNRAYISGYGIQGISLAPVGEEIADWVVRTEPGKGPLLPLVIGSDGRIIFGGSSQIIAVNGKGEKLWVLNQPEEERDPGFSGPQCLITDEGVLYYIVNRSLVAVSPLGQVRERIDLNAVGSTLTIGSDNSILVGTLDGQIIAFAGNSPIAWSPWAKNFGNVRNTSNAAEPNAISPATKKILAEKSPADIPEDLTFLPYLVLQSPTQRRLVMIVHGWRGDPSWVKEMAEKIEKRVDPAVWSVHWFDWNPSGAREWSPSKALENGIAFGSQLGEQLKTQGWEHVHLICHSAGAGMTQVITEKLISAGTTVHATFLDPFVGRQGKYVKWYGTNATWADNYFARDWSSGTESCLSNAWNVDVSAIANAGFVSTFCSGSEGLVVCDTNPKVSHSWPHEFYTHTVPPRTINGEKGYGFPLSVEGGGWDKRTDLARGNYPAEQLGEQPTDTAPVVNMSAAPPIELSRLPKLTADAEVRWNSSTSFTLKTRPRNVNALAVSQVSVGWVNFATEVTNAVDLLSLDVTLQPPGYLNGLLVVTWDGIEVARQALAATRSTPVLIAAIPKSSFGTHSMGFRLEHFGTATGVAVDNVAFLENSIKAPQLSFMREGGGTLRILSASGGNYAVERSLDLVQWELSYFVRLDSAKPLDLIMTDGADGKWIYFRCRSGGN